MSDTPTVVLPVKQGATFRWKFIWQDVRGRPIDLTGYTARMQIRDVTRATMLVELNTTNGGIALGGKAGTVTLYISNTATSAFAWTKGIYDIELTDPSSNVYRIVSGNVTVSQEVTI